MTDAFARFFSHPCTLLVIGGGVGTNARYWLGVWFVSREWTIHFPWHTFLINVLGSFVLGVVGVACRNRPEWFLLLGTGFCGGFTTFSTFSVETLGLIERSHPAVAAGYVFGSVAAGVAGAYAGIQLVK
jgi:CrcB protein